MVIQPSTPQDVGQIRSIFELGIAFQKSVFHRYWLGFDKDLLEGDIAEKRHWKIMEGEEIACVFSVQFEDPDVWGDMDNSPSVYLHRIVTHPRFRGNGYVPAIVDWAIAYGRANQKKFVRLDTFPDNDKLLGYYEKCGFRFCGLKEFKPEDVIPEHYRDGLALLELPI